MKKAYRKKAFELHPDRNYGNVESATQQFADVQAAYDILSDPQERAWYDSHRETLLRNVDRTEGNHFEANIPVTTTHDVLSMISRLGGQLRYDDTSTGFFGALQNAFDRLAHEEDMICQRERKDNTRYPSFGLADDDYQTIVRPFYDSWSTFATQKPFSWKDTYRYSEAPDRRTRRLMEKENKHLREEGIREFNDSVRALIAFARKRDPRVPSSKEAEIDRQAILRDAAAAQALRARQAHQAKVARSDTVPDWMQQSNIVEDEEDESEDFGATRQLQEFECVVCKKLFKSENQYESHAKSKRHLRALKKVRKDITMDEVGLGLGTDSPLDSEKCVKDIPGSEERVDPEIGKQASVKECRINTRTSEPTYPSEETDSDTQSSTSSATSLLIEEPESPQSSPGDPSAGTENSGLVTEFDEFELSRTESPDRTQHARHLVEQKAEQKVEQKLGRAKAKRAKKVEQAADKNGPSGQAQLICVACKAAFISRTKLFAHIKASNHAQPTAQRDAGRGGRKR